MRNYWRGVGGGILDEKLQEGERGGALAQKLLQSPFVGVARNFFQFNQ